MKFPRQKGLLFLLVVTFQLASRGKLSAQEALPLDFKAITKSHVPHVNLQGSGHGGSAPGTAEVASLTAFGGSPYSVGPLITATTTSPAAEEHIAVDPNNPSMLVAAISDFAIRGGFNTTKYAFSADNGASWAESYVEYDPSTDFLFTSDGFLWLANSDPVVAIDKSGNVYLSNVYIGLINDNGFYVSVANLTTGSVRFTAAETFPISTNPDLLTDIFEDKPWLTVDTSSSSHSGTVYASWSRFIGDTVDMIVFSKSINQGRTWSPPLQISLVSQNGAVQGSQVAVGPSGEVYVAYEAFFVGGKRQHFLAQSTDGGETFSTPLPITPFFNELSFNSTYRKNSFLSLAVNPLTSTVCVVYADQPGGSVGAQVEFIRWTPGVDASFSPPVVINDKAAGQQFFPAMTVDSGGIIHVSWFDTRNSRRSSSRYDIFATRSVNNGATFSPNARVTPTLINSGTASFIGDYGGIAAAGGFAHPVWTNGGFNGGRLQTAALR
jgi:hypothetical protein